MGVSLERVQFKFASIVGELCSEPDVLSQFAVWLDLRLAEYKLKGAISLDCSGEEPDPTWLKGLSKQKTPPRVNSQTDRRAQGHSPAAYRSPSLHRPAHSSSDSDIPLSQSHSVPSGELAERLSPDIVVVKEEPQDIFPIALHENASGVTSTGHKRSAAESSLGSHWSKSSSPSQSKMRRLSSKESSSNQSLMTVIGDYSANDHDVQESDTMGDNSLSGPSSSGHNMSAPLSKSADYSADQSTDLSDSALSNDQFLQEMRWSGHSSSTGGEAGPSNSNVSGSFDTIELKDYPAWFLDYAKNAEPRKENRLRKIRNLSSLPKSYVVKLTWAVGIFEVWMWARYGLQNEPAAETLDPETLDAYLEEFFTTVKRPSGQDYRREPGEQWSDLPVADSSLQEIPRPVHFWAPGMPKVSGMHRGHRRNKLRNLETLPKSAVANMVVAAGMLERWIWRHVEGMNQTSVETLEPETLNSYLVDFFSTVRRPDGTEYKPRSLESLRCNLDRYLREVGYHHSIISSPIFSGSQWAYRHRLRSLLSTPSPSGAQDGQPS